MFLYPCTGNTELQSLKSLIELRRRQVHNRSNCTHSIDNANDDPHFEPLGPISGTLLKRLQSLAGAAETPHSFSFPPEGFDVAGIDLLGGLRV